MTVRAFEYVKMKPREDLDKDFVKPKPDLVEPEGDLPLIGLEVESKSFGTYRVIRGRSNGSQSVYTVQFLDTGYISTNDDNSSSVKRGRIRDYLAHEVAGVGYQEEPLLKKNVPEFYGIWKQMLARCYNENHASYRSYGGKGVTVSPRWHSYKNFCEDMKGLPFYDKWLESPDKWELDKDYLSGKVYSRNTCLFIRKSFNAKLEGKKVLFKGHFFLTLADAGQYFGWSRTISAKRLLELGGSFLEDTDKVLYRPINPIEELVELY